MRRRRSFAERVVTFVQKWGLIRVLLSDSIEFAVADAKLERSDLLENEQYGVCPVGLCRLNDVFRTHLVYFRHFKLWNFRAGAV